MAGLGRVSAEKPEAGSQDIFHSDPSLKPRVLQKLPAAYFYPFQLPKMKKRDLGQLEILICLNSGPGAQNQPWKRVSFENFDPEV
jgi:hypothetical protein